MIERFMCIVISYGPDMLRRNRRTISKHGKIRRQMGVEVVFHVLMGREQSDNHDWFKGPHPTVVEPYGSCFVQIADGIRWKETEDRVWRICLQNNSRRVKESWIQPHELDFDLLFSSKLMGLIIYYSLQNYDQFFISWLNLSNSLRIIGRRGEMFHTNFFKKLSEFRRNKCWAIIRNNFKSNTKPRENVVD